MDFLIYSIFATILFVYFVAKSKAKLFIGVILFWLFASPSLYEYSLRIPVLNFDLNATRVLFIGVTILSVLLVVERGKTKVRVKRFEVWIILLVLSVLIAITINYSSIGIQKYISDLSYVVTFGLIYFIVQHNIRDQNDLGILKKAFLAFGIISAFVAFIQFSVEPEFLRIGIVRNAFGEYSRANGLFPNEFDQALFLIIVLVLNWPIARQKMPNSYYIILFGIAVFFTAHRISWFVYTISVLAMFYVTTLSGRKMAPIIVPLVFLLVPLFVSIFFIPWENIISSIPFLDSLLRERVAVDTWTVRTQYNLFALQAGQKYPLGLGIYGSEYTRMVDSAGLPLNRNTETLELVPYVVHNSFLATLVKYGWLGFLSLAAFLFGAIKHYSKGYKVLSKEMAAPIVVIGAYFAFSITQDFSFAVELQSLLVISVVLGMYASQESILLNDKRLAKKNSTTTSDSTI